MCCFDVTHQTHRGGLLQAGPAKGIYPLTLITTCQAVCKCFTYTIVFNLHRNPLQWVLLLCPCLQRGKQIWKRKVTDSHITRMWWSQDSKPGLCARVCALHHSTTYLSAAPTRAANLWGQILIGTTACSHRAWVLSAPSVDKNNDYLRPSPWGFLRPLASEQSICHRLSSLTFKGRSLHFHDLDHVFLIKTAAVITGGFALCGNPIYPWYRMLQSYTTLDDSVLSAAEIKPIY